MIEKSRLDKIGVKNRPWADPRSDNSSSAVQISLTTVIRETGENFDGHKEEGQSVGSMRRPQYRNFRQS